MIQLSLTHISCRNLQTSYLNRLFNPLVFVSISITDKDGSKRQQEKRTNMVTAVDRDLAWENEAMEFRLSEGKDDLDEMFYLEFKIVCYYGGLPLMDTMVGIAVVPIMDLLEKRRESLSYQVKSSTASNASVGTLSFLLNVTRISAPPTNIGIIDDSHFAPPPPSAIAMNHGGYFSLPDPPTIGSNHDGCFGPPHPWNIGNGHDGCFGPPAPWTIGSNHDGHFGPQPPPTIGNSHDGCFGPPTPWTIGNTHDGYFGPQPPPNIGSSQDGYYYPPLSPLPTPLPQGNSHFYPPAPSSNAGDYYYPPVPPPTTPQLPATECFNDYRSSVQPPPSESARTVGYWQPPL